MTTPNGILIEPLTKMKALIAEGSSFQTLTSAANATAALAFVHLFEVDYSAQPFFAAIKWNNRLNLDSDAAGLGIDAYRRHYSVQVMLIQTMAAHSEANGILFLNNCSAVLTDMLADQANPTTTTFPRIDEFDDVSGDALDEASSFKWTDETTGTLGYQNVWNIGSDI